MEKLVFNWLIENEVAGHSEPQGGADLAWLFGKGIRALVRLSECPLISNKDVSAIGLDDFWEPIPDFNVPSQERLEQITNFMFQCARLGKPVGVSCGAGTGRTAMVLACYLAARNTTSAGIIAMVSSNKLGRVENGEQVMAIERFTNSISRTVTIDEKDTGSTLMQNLSKIAEEYKQKYGRGFNHSETVTELALGLFRGLENLKLLPSPFCDPLLLRAAGYFHVVGPSIGEEHPNEEGFELLTERLSKPDMSKILPGPRKNIILYSILWLRGNDFSVRSKVAIKKPEQIIAKYLAGILRISDSLCFPGGQPVAKLSLYRQQQTLCVEVCPSKTGDGLFAQLEKAKQKADLLQGILQENLNSGITKIEFRLCRHSECSGEPG